MATTTALCALMLLLLPGLHALKGSPGQDRLVLYYMPGGPNMMTVALILGEKGLKFEGVEFPLKFMPDPRGAVSIDVDKANATDVARLVAVADQPHNRAVGFLDAVNTRPVLYDKKTNSTLQTPRATAQFLDGQFKNTPKMTWMPRSDVDLVGMRVAEYGFIAHMAMDRTYGCMDAIYGAVSGTPAPGQCTNETLKVYLDDLSERFAYFETVLPEYRALYKDNFTITDAQILPLFVIAQYWGVDWKAKGYNNIAAYLEDMKTRPGVITGVSLFPRFVGFPKSVKDALSGIADYHAPS